MRENLQILFSSYPFQMLLDEQKKIRTIYGVCFETIGMAHPRTASLMPHTGVLLGQTEMDTDRLGVTPCREKHGEIKALWL